jgi:hypothetical protein
MADWTTMRLTPATLVVILTACNGEDPPVVPDATPVDAAVVPPDAIPPCPECGTSYVLDGMQVPINADEAESVGFDLDGDGTVDNQMGNVFSALTQAAGGSIQFEQETELAIDRGDILLLASLQECLPGLCLFTYQGSDPAPAPCADPGNPATCGQHLDGSGTFTAEPPLDRFVPGSQVGDVFQGGPGQLVLAFSLGGGGAPIELELVEARANLTGVSRTGVTAGKVGGGIPLATIQNEVIPAIHTTVSAIIAADCTGSGPSCGCAEGSDGETMLGIFDDNIDCQVMLQELRDNPLVNTLLRPDVDIDGDDTPDVLSVGVGITAVGATFRN